MNDRIFEPKNDLEVVLIKAVVDKSHKATFYKTFLVSDVFVLVNGRIEEVQYVIEYQKMRLKYGDATKEFDKKHSA